MGVEKALAASSCFALFRTPDIILNFTFVHRMGAEGDHADGREKVETKEAEVNNVVGETCWLCDNDRHCKTKEYNRMGDGWMDGREGVEG